MSVKIEKGAEIPVAGASKGNGSRGPYFKVIVKAEKGYDKIQVWAANPSEAINITGMARVAEIKSARKSAHEYNGKWYDDVIVEAVLAQGTMTDPDFMMPEAVDDAELPFG